jgi:hypothetical protein
VICLAPALEAEERHSDLLRDRLVVRGQGLDPLHTTWERVCTQSGRLIPVDMNGT